MREHVLAVCERSIKTASIASLENDVRVTSLLHDLGKYTDRFEQRLNGIEKSGLDHSSAGAWAALHFYGEDGDAAAQAILGHHIGLQPAGAPPEMRCEQLRNVLATEGPHTGSDLHGMLTAFRNDGFSLPCRETFETAVNWNPGGESEHAAEMLDVRVLFSSLVDADFIETEAHFEGDANTPRRPRAAGPQIAAGAALRRVIEAAAEQKHRAQQEDTVSPAFLQLRKDVLSASLAAASRRPGLFTLTAPTGAGKTLSMLAFALAHAKRWKLRRVIMVIPYLTIIEQTARICRGLFDCCHSHFVLEDHSNARMNDEARDNVNPIVRQRRMLAENWDAPIVLTTSLAALESLHAHQPRRCRKLHNLVRSVLLFDEIQTLPPHLVRLTLASLTRLVDRFSSTIVFSTATQPAFDTVERAGSASRLCSHGWRPSEIVPPKKMEAMFRLAGRRYRVEWRLNTPLPWKALAAELHSQSAKGPVIAIVNVKRHAIQLVNALLDANGSIPVMHLSTNLCPKHRECVLGDAFRMLRDGCGFVFVTTQCIEAGVDISAPVVYRAMAPLESIAQAAGRCNRHGTDPAPGRVVVFLPEEEKYPPGAYETAAQQTKAFVAMLVAEGIDLNEHNILSDPSILRRYYEQLYQLGIHETKKASDLVRAVVERDFPEVSRLYRLIDQDTIELLVPYEREAFETLVAEIEQAGRLTRGWIAKARRFAVNIRRPQVGDEAATAIRPLPPGIDDFQADWFILQEMTPGELYDRQLLGLKELKASWFA
jgi:CRISPR-associated helicase Cas3/CRISPR-associated endonuclease Cas3-HD